MNLIAIDTETHMLRPEGKVRSHHDVPDMVCLTYDTGLARDLIKWDQPAAGKELRQLIGDKTVVMHNAKFDLAVISKWRPDLKEYFMELVDEGRVLDTMVLYALRYPLKDRLRSLSAIVQHLFKKRLDKGAVRTSFRRDQPISNEAAEYAMADAKWTLHVAQRLLEIPLGGLARQEQEFVVAAQPLYEGLPVDILYSSASAYLAWFLEPQGLPVNHQAVEEQYRQLESDENMLSERLYEVGLMRAVRTPGTPTKTNTQSTKDRRWTILQRRPLILQRMAGSRNGG